MVRDLETAFELKKKSQYLMNKVRDRTLAKCGKYLYLQIGEKRYGATRLRIGDCDVRINLDSEDVWITVDKKGVFGARLAEVKKWTDITPEIFPHILMVLHYLSGEYVNLNDKEDPDYVQAISKLVKDVENAVKELKR
jgi:hypothetical protein